MRHSLHNAYKGLAENLVPLRTAPGGFRTEGVLTPDEFVSAGDFLVATVPTWAWEGGERSRLKSFLCVREAFIPTPRATTITAASPSPARAARGLC